MAITASEARKNLFPLIEQVNDDRTAVEITLKRGSAVLMSRADDDALQETAHLLRAGQRPSTPGELGAGTRGSA